MGHVPPARIPSTVCLLVGCLVLAGCPKKSEVVPEASAPAGPTMTVPMGPPPGAGQPTAPGGPGGPSPEVQVTPPPGIAVQPLSPQGRAAGAAQGAAAAEASPLKDVFYEFDSATIQEDQKAALAADLAWLQGHAGTKVMIEGHCDERGSDEYNLALGERRARAVKDYLVAAGISADRISTISYGKERPFVLGHDENEWKWNRRAHFELQAK